MYFTLFYLKRFFIAFVLYFLVLICVIGSGDIALRMAALPSLSIVPKVFMLLLPHIAILALPIAASLAVFKTLHTLYSENELLPLRFFPRFREQCITSLIVFGLFVALILTPLVHYYAPRGYHKAKKVIIHSFSDYVSSLKPEIFHSLSQASFFYFKKKEYCGGVMVFYDIILMIKEQGGGDQNNVVFSYSVADHMYLEKNALIFENGYTVGRKDGRWYKSEFKKSTTEFSTFLSGDHTKKKIIPKYMTAKKLLNNLSSSPCYIEFHKRIVQLVWGFLNPLLAFFLFIALLSTNPSFSSLLVVSGGIFFISYILMSSAQATSQVQMLSLFFLYGGCTLLFLLCSYLYLKRKPYFL